MMNNINHKGCRDCKVRECKHWIVAMFFDNCLNKNTQPLCSVGAASFDVICISPQGCFSRLSVVIPAYRLK